MLTGYESTLDAVQDSMAEDEHMFMSLEHYYTALHGSTSVPPRSDVPLEAIQDAESGAEFNYSSLSCGVFFVDRENDKPDSASGTHDLACGLPCVFGEDLEEIAECSSLRESFDLRNNVRGIFFRPSADGAAQLAPFGGVRALALIWVVSDRAQEAGLEYVAVDDTSLCVFLEDRSFTAQSFISYTCALATGGNFGVGTFHFMFCPLI
jgi:hypothetical protein